MLLEQNTINATTTEIKDLESNGAVLLVQITSDFGSNVTRKIIY